jgi:hypothetical protein
MPEMKLINRSKSKVLILDREELKGAKQNRIVNATFLIGPKMEVVIPVSCVEPGRRGLGENVRLQGKGINGASLLVGNRVLHHSAFWFNGDGRGKRDSRFQRFSERRGRVI